ncbi:integrin beta-7 [Varanus komodoensis]|uniref:integrin beta-7 n=1 Tax=Varanus komodoensis TaxID=61221 RepID=UPI001CF79593|nr:integrin beta-7 [Varanus komodoensis]XP_044299065.1 integrin beta-7 [Varanus komodoensis]XP_044299066.1 integrin beta-7 [Varanus komodoensis]
MLPAGWIVRLGLPLLLLTLACGEEGPDTGSCQPHPSCHECIQSHPHCAWCKQVGFVQAGGSDSGRCAPRLELERRGCLPDEIVDPHGQQQILEDRPLSNSTQHQTITQLAPQRISLRLRPGEEQNFTVRFRRAEGYPVDLYYLMDLSYSMKDDLENIKRLGSDLLAALRDVTTSVKIGFGSFVDKTVLPYTSTAPSKRRMPCPTADDHCQPAFSYQHVLQLTDNASEFESRVSQQHISANMDDAEGGFDAIMQAAVCQKQIGWRDVTRLLVFTSDGAFHMAGDGKLGGVYLPNDGQCHLDANGLYTESHFYDYPSVAHLAEVLSAANIQPIFAVTGSMLHMYEELSRHIPKSVVGELKEDSSNVVQLIAEAYNSLSSTVNLEHSADLPPGISIAYDSHCGNSEAFGHEQGGECLGVRVNQMVQFTVRIKATACLPGPQKLVLRVLGVGEELQVQLTTACECQCGDAQPYAEHCSGGHGNFSCGVCSCQEGYVGRLCECQQEKAGAPEATCQDVNDTGPICSGKGQCVCGKCQCSSQASGPFCNCDNTACHRHNGQLCAGNGQCRCGTCQCDANYTGSACECSLDTSGCVQEGTTCSGHGRCVCNRCQCDPSWFGSHCSHCLDCQTPCELHRDCAECKAFGTGQLSANCSASCGQTVQVVPAASTHEGWCQMPMKGSSLLIFLIETDETGGVTLTVSRKEGTTQTVNLVLWLVLGLVLAGLSIMVLYRGIVEVQDRREFKRFEKELEKLQWDKANNPLFREATTTFINPKFN